MSGPLASIAAVQDGLARQGYVAGRRLSTAVFLALSMDKPLFLEGEPGVGKTEIAKALAAMLGRPLIRLQCYEGLYVSTAVYEWDYARQMLAIRLIEAMGAGRKAARGMKAYLGIRDVGPIADDTLFGIDRREHNFVRVRANHRPNVGAEQKGVAVS